MTESKPPAKAAPKSAAERENIESDPRTPDTTADQPSDPKANTRGVQPATELTPENYGFRPIEVTDAEESGPGAIAPTEVPAVSQGETFTERAKARGDNKAVQQAENK